MIICHIITCLDNGGAEAVLLRLCSAAWPSHYRHAVISLMGRGIYAERLEQAGITVHCLDMPRGKITVSGLFELWRLLKTLQPDVVQTWMYHADLIGGLVARLAGIRNIAWGIHNSNLEPASTSRSTRLTVKICAFLSPWLCRKIVSCSMMAAQVHQQLGYSHEKFVVIPNGYPLDRFSPDNNARHALRQQLGLPDNMPLLGMVARFDPLKDHHNLLQALGLLKQQGDQFTCLLVGTGMSACNTPLLQAIRQAGLEQQLRLLGPRDDIPAIMNALDLNLLSSQGEAFPNVLAEAMACGTPCISTDVGDAALIIGDTGWIVPPRQPQLLANAIHQALAAATDVAGWQTRKTACRQRIVDNFSLAKMTNAYQATWASMATTARARENS